MIPYFADGSGYYSDSILGCHKVICEAEPLVLDAIKLTSVKPGSVFTIADYGCADGGTSMPLLYACVQELRKIHGDDLPINVVYEDQPVNDFKSLFLRLQGKVVKLKEIEEELRMNGLVKDTEDNVWAKNKILQGELKKCKMKSCKGVLMLALLFLLFKTWVNAAETLGFI